MRALLLLLLLSTASAAAHAQDAGRRPLDHDAYDRWRQLAGAGLSSTGAFVLYRLEPENGDDGELHVHGLQGDDHYVVPRGTAASFDWDERFAFCRVEPGRELVRKSQKEKWKKDDQPRNALALIRLADGEVETVERVLSFESPEKAGGWVAWLHHERTLAEKNALKKKKAEEERKAREGSAAEGGEARPGEAEPEAEPEPEAEAEPETEAETEEEPEEEPGEPEPEEPAAQEPEPAGEPTAGEAKPVQAKPAARKAPFKTTYKKKKDEDPRPPGRDGTELVVRDLASGAEHRFEDVIDYAFSKDGRRLAFVTSSKDHSKDGVHVLALADGTVADVLAGDADYASLVFDESGDRLAFLSNKGSAADEEPRFALYLWTADVPYARRVADAGFEGVPAGWGVSEHERPSFSETGRRLFFGTASLPEPEPEEVPDDEKVVVDVWSWKDDWIQPMQLVRLASERRRDYLAVVHLDHPREAVVQLACKEVPQVDVAAEGESPHALGTSDLPYRRMLSWDTQVFRDAYVVDVASGAREKVVEGRRASYRISPGGRYLYWWDSEQSAWYARSVPDGEPLEVSRGVPHALENELHDSPSFARAHGSAGWTRDDVGFLVYDRHDLWLLDPAGVFPPRCVTEGVGRRENLRFRRVDLDREEPWIDPAAPMLLATFDYGTKGSGFHRDSVKGDREPEELLMEACSFSTPVRAERGGVLRFTRSSFTEYPDLWASDTGFELLRRISDANPQQAEYLWGTAELVKWTSTDGDPLEGLLYKPEDFDPGRKYPLLVYFYERSSDNLHRHSTPIPGRSTIQFPFYTSRGYVVFVPDIPYVIGYPGRSASHAVLPGIARLIDRGFVQEDAIGVQGHSWGGYQAAFLVTQTNLFAAAVAGAPVSNMTSAYGGIRWQTGMSRMFQYERTQSRIGGTLWEELPRFLDNSPLFFADRVETPLLILHNDKDGAVPWYQGIELFVALRRLDKPVWMLNYNGEGHGIGKYANKRDYAIRMQQFFDHFLKGAPPPVWLAEGVPATEKERNLGLDLIESGEDEER